MYKSRMHLLSISLYFVPSSEMSLMAQLIRIFKYLYYDLMSEKLIKSMNQSATPYFSLVFFIDLREQFDFVQLEQHPFHVMELSIPIIEYVAFYCKMCKHFKNVLVNSLTF